MARSKPASGAKIYIHQQKINKGSKHIGHKAPPGLNLWRSV
jgi:hypothetical protein